MSFYFAELEVSELKLKGRKVDLSLFKGAVLVHLVSLFREAENVKIGFSTQTCA